MKYRYNVPIWKSCLFLILQSLAVCYASSLPSPEASPSGDIEFTASYWGSLVGCVFVTIFCSSFGTPADIFIMFLLSLIPMGLHDSVPIAAVLQGFIVLPQIPILIRKRSPESNRHLLIAWDEIFVLESFTLAGVQIGVAIHNYAPPGLLLLILSIGGLLLALHSFYVFARYRYTRNHSHPVTTHEEPVSLVVISSLSESTPQSQNDQETQESNDSELVPPSHQKLTKEQLNLLGSSKGSSYSPDSESKASELAAAAKSAGVSRVAVSKPRIFIFVGIFFVSLLLSLAAANHVTGIALLSVAWWLIWSIKLLTVLLYGFLMAYLIKADIEAYKRGDLDVALNIGHSHEHTLHMNFKKWLIECLFIGVTSGIVAGSLGISGSHIKNPMALRFGHSPSVVVANSVVMMGLTALEQFIEYALIGTFPWKASYPLCIACFLTAPIGLIWVFRKGRHHKMDPYIPVITGVAVALAAIAILFTRRSELTAFLK